MKQVINWMEKKAAKMFFVLAVLSAANFSNIIAQNENTGIKNLSESDQFRSAINMCPLGIALGIFSANYEYMITKTHGIMARLDYEAVPGTYSDAKLEVDGKAAILNYRYHIDEKLGSCYIGAFARYRIYNGEGIESAQKFDFDISEFTLGLNAGKRWVWDSGFNINFALGYGYVFDSRSSSRQSSFITSSINKFEDEYDFINGFLGEFSIGYAF